MHHLVETVFRQEYARVFAALVRQLGDFDLAEDALMDAFSAALRVWPTQGVPAAPGAWLTTAARNAATSMARHRTLAAAKHELLVSPSGEAAVGPASEDFPDERLRLVFTCCHPALSLEARVALTLNALCGLPVPAIARLLLAEPAAVAQRLVRAKRKIRLARIPYEVPDGDQLAERLSGVLSVIYLLFTEGYGSTDDAPVVRAALCDEAIRMGRALSTLLPSDPEVGGLLALMLLHHARRDARTDADGDAVPLEAQDRARWDAGEIAEGLRLLDAAMARRQPGPYQVEAAIAALHATAPSWRATDWAQLAALYDTLVASQPSPSAYVARALAHGMAYQPARGLALLAQLGDGALVWAARAELQERALEDGAARASWTEAVARARNDRERRFFMQRARRVEVSGAGAADLPESAGCDRR